MRKINNKPFELVGFSYSEYENWCKENSKNPKKKITKKEFFKLIYDFKLIKKDGRIIDLEKENG